MVGGIVRSVQVSDVRLLQLNVVPHLHVGDGAVEVTGIMCPVWIRPYIVMVTSEDVRLMPVYLGSDKHTILVYLHGVAFDSSNHMCPRGRVKITVRDKLVRGFLPYTPCNFGCTSVITQQNIIVFLSVAEVNDSIPTVP